MEQVPPPLVIGLDYTRDIKGSHVNVCVYQKCDGSDKNLFPIKLCFYQRVIQPKIAFISQGTGKGITDFGENITEMMFYLQLLNGPVS